MGEEQTPLEPEESACPTDASPAQLLYARILRVGTLTGLAVLAVTYTIYAFGIMDPYVPLEDLSTYYSLPAKEYLEKADVRPGWSSFLDVGHADSLCFLGLITLASLSLICYLGVLPLLLKRRDKIYAAMAIAQIIVLLLAASGLLTGGR
jgi:hypothetical protein